LQVVALPKNGFGIVDNDIDVYIQVLTLRTINPKTRDSVGPGLANHPVLKFGTTALKIPASETEFKPKTTKLTARIIDADEDPMMNTV